MPANSRWDLIRGLKELGHGQFFRDASELYLNITDVKLCPGSNASPYRKSALRGCEIYKHTHTHTNTHTHIYTNTHTHTHTHT